MEILLITAIVGTLNVVCFLIGAKVGQTVSRGETIELPSVNPIKAMREYQDGQEARREQERLDTIMHNIDNYDGTGNGQKDVPRG